MPKALLTEAEFGRLVVSRARRERPDIRVRAVGRSLLMVEAEPGRRRMVSLLEPYQDYLESPSDRDALIGAFLGALVYEEPGSVRGSFAENRHKVMPQVVPPSLLDFCRRDRRELASVSYVGGLSIAFVVDEPDRYSYIHQKVMEGWAIDELDLLRAAIENLREQSKVEPVVHRIGTGDRTTLVWESFDGYDASRILLQQELTEAAAVLAGNPVVAIPHRDYMILFGDADPEFVSEMAERIREDFEAHSYPITPRLFALVGGGLEPYEGPHRRERILN